jgi:hypothetical protein
MPKGLIAKMANMNLNKQGSPTTCPAQHQQSPNTATTHYYRSPTSTNQIAHQQSQGILSLPKDQRPNILAGSPTNKRKVNAQNSMDNQYEKGFNSDVDMAGLGVKASQII